MIEPTINFDFDAVDGRPSDTDGSADYELVLLRGMIEAAATSETPATCFAAILVLLGRFTQTEAARKFRVSDSTVKRAVERLRLEIRARATIEDTRADLRRKLSDITSDQ